MRNSEYREMVGERLRATREARGLTAYRVAKDGGISISQVKIVERGTTNYTIDVLLGYLRGSGLKISIQEALPGNWAPASGGQSADV